MSGPNYNTVEWFEVATDRPDEARRFYGELFGWSFEGGGAQYSGITTPGSERPQGGLFDSQGNFPGYAIFYVTVEDVAATLAKAESLGGKTIMPVTELPNVTIALFADPEGHVIGIAKGM